MVCLQPGSYWWISSLSGIICLYSFFLKRWDEADDGYLHFLKALFSFLFSTSSSPPYVLSTCCARYHKSALAWFSPQVYASFKDVLLYTSHKVQLGHQMEGHVCIASAQTVGRQNSDGIRSVPPGIISKWNVWLKVFRTCRNRSSLSSSF